MKHFLFFQTFTGLQRKFNHPLSEETQKQLKIHTNEMALKYVQFKLLILNSLPDTLSNPTKPYSHQLYT